jgi:uncharacterized protein YegJ (DUF2314 family)
MTIVGQIKSWLRSGKPEDPLISVVLFLRRPIEVTEERIRRAAISAWGRDLHEKTNEYIINKPPVSFVRFGDVILMVNNVSRPYVSEEYRQNQASSEFKELRQLKVVMEHQAFLTVDLMHPKNPGSNVKHSAYQQMCSLAAEFLDDNCLGISFAETGYLRPYDRHVKDSMKGDDPLREMSQSREVPVISASADDAQLHAAAMEARNRWAEFASAFHCRRPGQMFSVKAPFRDGENIEWFWVATLAIDRDTLEGSVDNSPLRLKNIREGDHVRIPISVISDWIYTDDTKVIGGFSLKAFRKGR